MNSKSCCCKKAAPSLPGRLPQEPKQKHAINRVNEDTDEVMAGGVQSEHLHVGHVAEPSQRMPVGCVKRTERPLYALPTEAGLDLRIIGDVERIVVAQETVARERQKNCDDGREQK